MSMSNNGHADIATVLDRIDQERENHLEELKEYLRIPSISTDPEYREEVRRCADFLIGKMQDAGLQTELLEADGPGHPIVYAERIEDPSKPTILFYGHYDVQPADPIELWRNPPFEPTVEGDHLVARGATDDKGQSFAHLKAVASLIASATFFSKFERTCTEYQRLAICRIPQRQASGRLNCPCRLKG